MSYETRVYENDERKVLWKAAKCQHSGNCVNGNPKAFNPKKSHGLL